MAKKSTLLCHSASIWTFLTVSRGSEVKKKAEFAKILGIPQPNLSKYESGRVPPADVLQKIANYGGVTAKWLLTGKEEKKNLEQPGPRRTPPISYHMSRSSRFLLAQVLGANEEFWGGLCP